MEEEDRRLIADTVNVMHELRSELLEFRGEMKEFKTQAVTRLNSLETEQAECQKNPTVCATARSLDAHTRGHAGAKSLAISIWAACVSNVMCAFTLFMAFIKKGP